MKKFKPVAKGSILLILLICVCFVACHNGHNTEQGTTTIPRTGKVKVKPHNDPSRSDTYCTYKITAVPKGGAMKVGDLICIFCTRQACDNFSSIEVPSGLVYTVTAQENGLPCTSCPAADATQPGQPYEE